MEVARAFDQFVATLRAAGNPVAGRLRPGLPVDQQERLCEAAGFLPSEDVVAWYATFDGLDSYMDDSLCMFSPVFEPVPLEKALRLRAQLIEWHGNPAHFDLYLPGIERFLPIGELGMLKHCAVWDGERTAIHRFDPPDTHDAYMTPVWPSIEAMLAGWAQRWKSGEYRHAPGRGAVEA